MPSACRTAAALLALALAGTVHATAEDPNAQITAGELAYKRGDCGRATSDLGHAEQALADARVAAKATAVAIECGEYGAALHAAERWHTLAPSDASAIYGRLRAQLGLYQIDAARASFEELIKIGALQSLRGREGGERSRAASSEGDAVAERIGALAQDAGVAPVLAMLRSEHSPVLHSAPAQLALADLALEGWNYRLAVQYAHEALTLAPTLAGAQAALSRAYAGLGEADPALAAARAARTAAPADQAFASVDALLALGRDREAREALEALRDDKALHGQAVRRLGMLAFGRGDYDEAKRDFTELLPDNNANAAAVYYLSAIAERGNEVDQAVRGYELLAGTALGAAARSRAATLLYKQGQHDAALELLQVREGATPLVRLEAEVARAQLLTNVGEPEHALARLDDALQRFPAHSDLLYQRAVTLERGGHVEAALTQLKTLLDSRPGDPAVSNALGYTLADHSRELPRAEALIRAALDIEPDNPAILDSLGWLDVRRGQARASLPLFERAFRLDPDGDIGAHWGEALWALGEKAKARDVWTRALIADPDNTLVREAQRRAGVPQLPTTGTGTSI